MTNATQVAKVVSQLPGGIGIVAAASLDGSVAELRGDDPIVQPLILVTMGEETSASSKRRLPPGSPRVLI
jgi:hypothetical protein